MGCVDKAHLSLEYFYSAESAFLTARFFFFLWNIFWLATLFSHITPCISILVLRTVEKHFQHCCRDCPCFQASRVMRIIRLSEAESCNSKNISQGFNLRGKKNRFYSYTKESLYLEYFKAIFIDILICHYHWWCNNYYVPFLSPVYLSFSLKLCILKTGIRYIMLKVDENIRTEDNLNISGIKF